MATPCQLRPPPPEITIDELRREILAVLTASPEPLVVTAILRAIRARYGTLPRYGDEHRLSANDVRRALDGLVARGRARCHLPERLNIARSRWEAIAETIAAE